MDSMDFRELQTRAHSEFISNRVGAITSKTNADNINLSKHLDNDMTADVNTLKHGCNSYGDNQSSSQFGHDSYCEGVNYGKRYSDMEHGFQKDTTGLYGENNTLGSRFDRSHSLNPESLDVYKLPPKSDMLRKNVIQRSASMSPSLETSGHHQFVGHPDYSNDLTKQTQDHRPPMTHSLSVNNSDSVQCHLTGLSEKQFYSYTPDKNDGMMETERDDGAINLSTAVKSPGFNGDIAATVKVENGHTSQGSDIGSFQFSRKFTDVSLTIPPSKRKHRQSSASSPSSERHSPALNGAQTVLMLAAQHGLSPQQVQQLLQNQQGAPSQPLSQLIQQQSIAIQHQGQQKAQEQLLAQLNEQLQLNVLQQSQLLQQESKASCTTSQQHQLQVLVMQQQHLVQQIQQIQLQQRQFILACLMQPFASPQGVMSSTELQQIWKDATYQGGATEDQIKASMNGLPTANPLLAGSVLGVNGMTPDAMSFAGPLIGQPAVAMKTEDVANPLYRHRLCKWPGCDTQCDDIRTFTKHLNDEHTLDDRNTAQARVQMQVVTQLEIQLAREKELLHAMMQHLHFKPQRDREDRQKSESKYMASATTPLSVVNPVKSMTTPVSLPSPPSLPALISAPSLPPLAIPSPATLTSISKPVTPQSRPTSQPQTPTGLGPIRRRVSDKCNLPVSAEIQRNREFYKNTDVRPPFTYASLIRQAIIESQNRQLTLNEVYQWFQNTFAYFRRNEATWKNAVRHNLSLHKCFMRVENVKGAVWTVDEIEFYKRRPQKLSGSGSNSASMSPADHGYVYGDPLSSSLKALDQSLLMSQHFSNGSVSSDGGAEDLSMKSHNNSNDSFSASKSNSPIREDMSMFMLKVEPTGFRDDLSNGASPKGQCSPQGLDLSPHSQQQLSPYTARLSPQGRHLSSTSEKSPSIMYSHTDERTGESIDVDFPIVTERHPVVADTHYSDSGESIGVPLNMQIKGKTFSQSEALNNISVNQSAALNMTREEELFREAHMVREMALARAQEAELVNQDLIRAHEAELVRQEEFSRVREMAEFHEEQMRERENVSGTELSMNGEALHIREAELTRTREEELMQSTNQMSPPTQDGPVPMQQVSVNQDMYSPLLHTNNMMTVPHSIS